MLQHNVTGRECGRDTRGLPGLLQVAAEVLEGYSVAKELPLKVWGVNPKPDSPAYNTRTRKGTQITSSCEKQLEFCLPGREREMEIQRAS